MLPPEADAPLRRGGATRSRSASLAAARSAIKPARNPARSAWFPRCYGVTALPPELLAREPRAPGRRGHDHRSAAAGICGETSQAGRAALNKAERANFRRAWLDVADAPPAITGQAAALSARWSAEKGLPELGFTPSASDEQRPIHGLTTYLSVSANDQVCGLTSAMLRRRAEIGSFRNAMKFPIAHVALTCRAEGVAFSSLSTVPRARHARAERRAAYNGRSTCWPRNRSRPTASAPSSFSSRSRPRRETVFPGYSRCGDVPSGRPRAAARPSAEPRAARDARQRRARHPRGLRTAILATAPDAPVLTRSVRCSHRGVRSGWRKERVRAGRACTGGADFMSASSWPTTLD